jgi:hypothetical protein
VTGTVSPLGRWSRRHVRLDVVGKLIEILLFGIIRAIFVPSIIIMMMLSFFHDDGEGRDTVHGVQ